MLTMVSAGGRKKNASCGVVWNKTAAVSQGENRESQLVLDISYQSCCPSWFYCGF